MDYQKQALDFAKSHGIKLTVLSHRFGYMDNWVDGVTRCIFTLCLSRGRKHYTFKFGQSTADGSKEPTMYDVLSCLQKYDVGDLADFCSEFGYEPNKQVRETYKAVCKEYKAVERLFGDILEELQDIQ